MSIKNILIILILSLNLTGCQWAYEQQDIFNPHLSTKTERDNNSIEKGENPISRPTYNEYREFIDDKKVDNYSNLP